MHEINKLDMFELVTFIILFDAEIDSIVNIKCSRSNISYTGTSYVALVSYNQSRRNRIYRNARSFIVISYSSHHGSDLIGRHAEMIQNSECHERTALRVVNSVYKITYVVQISCDSRELNLPFRITERGEDVRGILRNLTHVGKAVLGKAESPQGLVRLGYISLNVFVIFDVFKGYIHKFLHCARYCLCESIDFTVGIHMHRRLYCNVLCNKFKVLAW